MSNKIVGITLKLNDKASAGIKAIQKRIDSFKGKFMWTKVVEQKFKSLNKASGFPVLSKSLGSFRKSFGNLTKEAGKFGMKLFAVSGIALGGLVALAKGTKDYASNLDENVRRIGFNVEAYQELEFAAKKSGVSSEDFASSMQKMTRSVGEARAGQGALYGFLKKTNPQLLKQVLATKDNNQAFDLLIGSLGGLKDASKQAAYANIVFGKSGANFTNLANAGKDGVGALRKEARELGIMTDEQVTKAAAFGGIWDSLNHIFQSIRNTIGSAVIPVLSQLGEKFIAFYKLNQDKITEFAKVFAEKLPVVIASLAVEFERIMTLLAPLGALLLWMGENFGYIKTGVALLAVTIGQGFVLSMLAATKATIGLGLALLTTPIGWILLGIAAIVLAFANWRTILDFFINAWSGVINVLMMINPVFKILVDSLKWVWENWDQIFSKISDKIKSVTKLLPSWLGGSTNADLNVKNTSSATSTVIHKIAENKNDQKESLVKVSFDNMPKGSRVESKGDAAIETDYRMGFLTN